MVKENEAVSVSEKYVASDLASIDQIVSTHVYLLTGYGWEGYNNQFCGGPIFHGAVIGGF